MKDKIGRFILIFVCTVIVFYILASMQISVTVGAILLAFIISVVIYWISIRTERIEELEQRIDELSKELSEKTSENTAKNEE